MLRYAKGADPRCLVEARATPDATWESLGKAQKDELREALVRDQGWLCAYCQRRIRPKTDRMKIEHWTSRSEGGEDLTWSNLLGACLGDADLEEGLPPGTTKRQERIHCDSSKADRTLFLHPVEGRGPSSRDFLRYRGNGEVTAADARADQDIATLNLNVTRLTRGRKEILEALKVRLDRRGWTGHHLRGELTRIDTRSQEGHALQYQEVARYYLKRWLRRIS